ncbi:hypothetical protein HW988_13870 [Bdellovibrio sp. KM01]|nr:hypothetical protein HW988_13870 [Bdellovibrio sp. KM01]
MSAQADILFVDVNNSPKEIEAAQKAAIARHEKLIVIPDPQKQTAQDKELRRQIDQATNNARTICNKSPGKDCGDAIQARTNLVEKQMKSPNYVSSENLSSQLAVLKKNGSKLSSVIISGHDGNGHFGGSQGLLNDKDIAEAFAQNAPVGDEVRSMMLWGCYTANIGSLTSYWKKTLPNVELIAGYDGIAPLGDKPANWDYLSDVLIKEKKLTAIKDANELKKALQGLDGTNLLNASLCVDDNFASNKFALNLKDAKKLCAGTLEAVKPAYECYLKAEDQKCANPPKNTGNSELRTAYNKLQDSRHCAEIHEGQLAPDTPSPDILIRLIHFQNVKDNLTRVYPQLFSRYNELVNQLNMPKEMLWGDISKMTRQEILNKLKNSADLLMERTKVESPDTPELWALMEGYNSLNNTLGNLQVPFGWVEPSANEKAPWAENGLQGMSSKGISNHRYTYERVRAYRNIDKAAIKMVFEKNPEFKAMVEKKEDLYTKLQALQNSETANDSAQIREARQKEITQVYQKYVEADDLVRTAGQKELTKYEPQLRAEVKKMAAEPYAHKEGLKIYQNQLDKRINELFKTPALSPEELNDKINREHQAG